MSGRARLIKPDTAIYRLVIERFALDPTSTAFVDDSIANVKAANQEGMHGIHFRDAPGLCANLNALGMGLSEPRPRASEVE